MKRLLSAALLLGLVACQSDAPPDCSTFGQPVPLFSAQVQSRVTVEDFQQQNKTFKIKQLHSEDYPAQGKCDLYALQTITASYKHHGIDGDMVFSFFNNQLKQVLFYPTNAADSTAFLESLCAKEQICLTDAQVVQQGCAIRKGTSADNRFYVVWEDFCLMEQMNQWLAKCS